MTSMGASIVVPSAIDARYGSVVDVLLFFNLTAVLVLFVSFLGFRPFLPGLAANTVVGYSGSTVEVRRICT